MLAILSLTAVFLTAVLSGIFGMAGGLILMGVLGAVYSVAAAMVLHGIAQLLANGIRAHQLRKSIYRPGLVPYFAGSVVAFALLQWISFVPDRKMLFIFLGTVPFAALLIRPLRFDFKNRAHAALCGFAVGLVQLSAGVAGPLLDVFFTRTSLTRHQIVGTKAVTQAFSHAFKIAFYLQLLRGWPAEIPPWLAAAILPLSYAGTLVGVRVLDRMSDKSFLRYTQAIVLVIGAVYLAKGLLAAP